MIGLIFGPPGSGKGTQAAHVEREFKLSHLSTGDILRAEVARGTEIGKEAERIMRAGDLVPDDLIIRIVQGILRDPNVSSEVLLDGNSMFDKRVVKGLIEGHGGRRNNAERLFGLTIFELWRRAYGI